LSISLGIVGASLLGYILVQNKRKKIEESKIVDKIKKEQNQEDQEEIRRLEEGEPSDYKRQKENRDRYTPTGFK
jgi:hypothetical protein